MSIQRSLLLIVFLGATLMGLGASGDVESPQENQRVYSEEYAITPVPGSLSDYEGSPVAVFAGGCFWGVESMFERLPGVLDVVSGYTGGTMEFPTYRYVSMGQTGHVEAVAVFYDPEVTDYETLARFFFEIHDPTQVGGQGPDIGPQYESAIFYATPEERQIAERLMEILEGVGYELATRVEEVGDFYRAEGYHQDYYARNETQPYCHAYTRRFPDEPTVQNELLQQFLESGE
jgi:methionine-S-sulfoxide reductase